MNIQVDNNEAILTLEGKLFFKIQFEGEVITFQMRVKAKSEVKLKSEVKKREKKKEKVEDQLVLKTIGTVKSESYGRLVYEPVEVSLSNPFLTVEFSHDGSQFSVFRDKENIIRFASIDGPVGKSGGTARISSGEKRSFCLGFLVLVYLAQVELPKKDPFFHYKDTGQNAILATDSATVSVEEKKRKRKKNDSKKSSPTKIKILHEKPRTDKLSSTSSSESDEPNTPDDSTNTTDKSHTIKAHEESLHMEVSEEFIKSVRYIEEQLDEISVTSLIECWSQLESIASLKSDD
jgi:hypothetical protein